nr:retrovirus-related Pol polyprotein from transposon TNT 1-94 [Tanacetum cinerariifolium]
MKEYIRIEEEKARKRAIVYNEALTSEVTLSCEPTVSPLNDNQIDFRISFDESDDEDYTIVYDKISFSYKIIYVDDLKKDSENDNNKVNMPSFPSSEPMEDTTYPCLHFTRYNEEFKFNTPYPEDFNTSLYCRGKENRVNILKSIDEGPFQMGTVREPLAKGTDGAPHLGPKRPRVYSNLSPEEKDMYDADIRATNILLQAVVVQNVQGRQNRGQGTNLHGGRAAGYGGVHNRVGNANPSQARQVQCYNCNGIGHIARNCTKPKRPQNSDYFKDKMLLMQAQKNGVALDEVQLLFLAGGQANAIGKDVDEQHVQDLALNVDNVFQADDCDAFDSDVDKAPKTQTMFMVNLSSADPIYDEAGPAYDSDILSETFDSSLSVFVLQAVIFEFGSFDLCDLGAFIDIIIYSRSLDHPCCGVLPSCEKSVVSISDSSTNKALQIMEDPSCLQPFLNGEHELLAPIHILPGGSGDLEGSTGTGLQSHLGIGQHQDSRPPSSSRWTVQVDHPVNQSINMAISLVYASSESSGGGEYLDAKADAQLFVGTGTSDDGIDQAGSGVAGRSSSRGFHQSCRKFTLGIWALPMSSSSDDLDGGGGGGGGSGTWEDPEAQEDPEAPDGPAGGGGGGG